MLMGKNPLYWKCATCYFVSIICLLWWTNIGYLGEFMLANIEVFYMFQS